MEFHAVPKHNLALDKQSTLMYILQIIDEVDCWGKPIVGKDEVWKLTPSLNTVYDQMMWATALMVIVVGTRDHKTNKWIKLD